MRTRLAGPKVVLACRWRNFLFGMICALQLDSRGRALSSARPCPPLWWVPASPLGSEDLPERRMRRCAQRCDRPRPPTCAHLGAHMRMYADNCLLSRSADDAQTIDTAAIGVVTGVLIAVAVATHSFLSPQRCRSDTCSRLRPCAAIWDPSIDSGRRVCLGIGCSVGGGCCGCPWGVVELAGSASLQVGTHLLAVARCALPSRGVL